MIGWWGWAFLLAWIGFISWMISGLIGMPWWVPILFGLWGVLLVYAFGGPPWEKDDTPYQPLPPQPHSHWWL